MRSSQLHLVIIAAYILFAFAMAKARPQQFSRPEWSQGGNSGWNQGGNNNWNQLESRTSTTPRPGTTVPTTASPRFLACMQRCQATSEYNPVCGSDSISYHNAARLQCAILCGKDVASVRMGTCNPL